ncbi:MAG: TatD family hydrolase [Treponemataceae bacterium]|nr:TatD family hydrolase [Treponemataceae bacterium]
MFFDFHTHFDFYGRNLSNSVPLTTTLNAAIDCVVQNNIFTVGSSVNIESWERNKTIADRVNAAAGRILYLPTFGIHPSYTASLPSSTQELQAAIEPYLAASAIIGEAGLDYFWETKTPPQRQETVLAVQLDHCERTGKYIVLHTKGAEQRILEMLSDFPHARPIIHWYDGPEDVYKKLLDRGYPQTFGVGLRYNPVEQRQLRLTPRELILSETDNPESDRWLGGTDDSPALICRVVADIASVLGIQKEEAAALIEHNSLNIRSDFSDHGDPIRK